MKVLLRKAVALFLVLCMLVSVVPAGSLYAAGSGYGTGIFEDVLFDPLSGGQSGTADDQTGGLAGENATGGYLSEGAPAPAPILLENTDYITQDNGFIQYAVGTDNAGFYILPSGVSIDYNKEPSSAKFLIDGRSYRFGADYPGLDTTLISPFINEFGTTQATWYLMDYEISQLLNIVEADAGDSYAVYVGYEIRSRTGQELPAPAVRIVVDTVFGAEDDLPVIMSGKTIYQTNEATYAPVPEYYRVDEVMSPTGPYAYGILVDEQFATPESVTFGHFQNLVHSNFDYIADTDLDFTAAGNYFGYADSAIALTYRFDTEAIPAGETISASTLYGFSGYPAADTDAGADVTDEAGGSANAAQNSGSMIVGTAVTETAENPKTAEMPEQSEIPAQPGNPAELLSDEDTAALGILSADVGIGYVPLAAGDVNAGVNLDNVKYLIIGSQFYPKFLDSEYGSMTAAQIADVKRYGSNIRRGYVQDYIVENLGPELKGDGTGTPSDGFHIMRSAYPMNWLEFFPYRYNEIEDILSLPSTPFNASITNYSTSLVRAWIESGEFSGQGLNHNNTIDWAEKTVPFMIPGHGGFGFVSSFTPTERLALQKAGNSPIAYISAGATTVTADRNGNPVSNNTAIFLKKDFDSASSGIDENKVHVGNESLFYLDTAGVPQPFPATYQQNAMEILPASYYSLAKYGFDYIKNGTTGSSSAATMGKGLFYTRPLVQLNPERVVALTGGDGQSLANPAQMILLSDPRFNRSLTPITPDFGNIPLTLYRNAHMSEDVVFQLSAGIHNSPIPSTEFAEIDRSQTEYASSIRRLGYKVVDPTGPGTGSVVFTGVGEHTAPNSAISSLDAPLSFSKDEIAKLTDGREYDLYVWYQADAVLKSDYTVPLKSGKLHSSEASDVKQYRVKAHLSPFKALTDIDPLLGGTLDIQKPAEWADAQPGDFYPGDTVTFTNRLTCPDDMRIIVEASYTDKNNEVIPLILTKPGGVTSETYTIKALPDTDITLKATAVSKDTRFVSGLISEDGLGAEFARTPTIYPNKVAAGILVTVTSSISNSAYYLERVQVYSNRIIGEETVTEPLNVFEGGTTHEALMYNGQASFRVPQGQDDITVYVQTAAKPLYDIEIDTNGMAVFPVYSDSLNNGNNLNAQGKPGSTFSVKLDSRTQYLGFSLDDTIASSKPTMRNPIISKIETNSDGYYSGTYSFPLEEFKDSADADKVGTYTLKLLPKPLYKPYTVTGVTTNADNVQELTTLTVNGTMLGQILGEDGLNLLEDPELAERIQQITFGLSEKPEENISIDLGTIQKSTDGTSLTIPVPKTVMDQLAAKNTEKVMQHYLTVGTKANSVLLSPVKGVRFIPFSLMGIAKTGDGYGVFMADSDKALKEDVGSVPLLTIKGSFFENTATGEYSFTKGNILFNGAMTYGSPQDGCLTVSNKSGTVEIVATKGTLSMPGLSFFSSDRSGFRVVLDKNKQYTTAFYNQPGYENVSFDWGYQNLNQNTLRFVHLDAGLDAELSKVTLLTNKLIFGGKLSLGLGTAELANVDIERLQFGINNSNATFEGVKASGSVGLKPESIPFLSIGASGAASIDTFEDIYEFEVNIDMMAVELAGKLILKPVKNVGVIPDTVKIFIAATPGIPIIPGVLDLNGGGGGISHLADTINMEKGSIPPILLNLETRISIITILTLDGGITVGPSQLSFFGRPSIGIGSLSIKPFRKLEGGFYLTKESITGKFEVEMVLVEGFEVVKGSGSVSAGYNWKSKKPTFSGQLSASVQIPKFKLGLLKFGPVKLGSAELGISTSNVYAQMKILKIVTLGVKYVWGKKAVDLTFKLFSEDGSPYIGSEQLMKDKDGNVVGVVRYGDNVRLVSSSAHSYGADGRLSVLGDDDLLTTYEFNDMKPGSLLTFQVPDGLSPTDIIVEYSTDGTNYDPFALVYPRVSPQTDTDPYTEAELNGKDPLTGTDDVNAMWIRSAGEPDTVTFTPDVSAGRTYWKITSGSGTPFAYELVEVDPLPELTAVIYDHAAKAVSYSAVNLSEDSSVAYSVSAYLTEKVDLVDKSGVYLGGELITKGGGGIASGTLFLNDALDALDSSNLENGRYCITLYLQGTTVGEYELIPDPDDEGNFIDGEDLAQTVYSIATDETHEISFANPLIPAPVQAITVTPSGDGTVCATWSGAKNPQATDANYEISVFDDTGAAVYKDMDVDLAQTPAGTEAMAHNMQYTYRISADQADDSGDFSVILSGLPVGKIYRFQIVPYVDVPMENVSGDNTTADFTVPVHGAATMSANMYLPVANTPQLDLSFIGAVSETDASTGILSAVSRGKYQIRVASGSQRTTIEVTDHSGAVLYRSASPEVTATIDISQAETTAMEQIRVVVTNAAGDSNTVMYTAYRDDTAPVLMVEADKNGTVKTDDSRKFTLVVHTESGAAVSMTGEAPVRANEEGICILSGTLSAGVDSGLYTVLSSDTAGNASSATLTVEYGSGSAVVTPQGGGGGGGGAPTPPVETTVKASDTGLKGTIKVGDAEIAYEIVDGFIRILPTPEQISAFTGDIVIDLSVIDLSDTDYADTGITGAELIMNPSWFDKRGGDTITLILPTGERLRINDAMLLADSRSLKEDVHVVIQKGSTMISLTEGPEGAELAFDFRNPAIVGVPFESKSGQNKDFIVAERQVGTARSASVRSVIPRSWYNSRDALVFARAYRSGTYTAANKEPEGFTDTAGQWMAAAVDYMAARGVVGGVGDNRYDPESDVTRAEFIALLVRMLGVDIAIDKTKPFDDVPESEWYYQPIMTARALGLTEGVGDNRFSPLAQISRQDMFTLLYNAIEKINALDKSRLGDFNGFSDWSDVADYAQRPSETLARLKLVNGFDGALNPRDTSSRAEAAQILYNVLIFDQHI